MAEPWKLTAEEKKSLTIFNGKMQHVRDAVRGVVKNYQTGLFISGEGGTSKSYTVIDELKQLKCKYVYHNTRLTARGLVDALERSPKDIHLVEDAETLMDDKKSFGVLRSALWSQSNEKPVRRPITWGIADNRIDFDFFGGIIVISNVNLADSMPEIRAIKTRIECLVMDVSAEEILALMKQICASGYEFGDEALTAVECWEVCERIIEKMAELKRRLDIRLLLNGFRKLLQYKAGESKTHWHQMLDGMMTESVTYQSRAETKTKETKIALEIFHMMKASLAEKLKAWKDRTGLEQAAYYRALRRSKK